MAQKKHIDIEFHAKVIKAGGGSSLVFLIPKLQRDLFEIKEGKVYLIKAKELK